MLLWANTRMVYSETHPIVSTQLASLQEGMAVVYAMESGVMKVQPSAGATSGIGTKLAGILMSPRRTFGINLGSATVVTPTGGGTVLLPNTVSSTSDVGIFLASSAGTALTATTSAASSTNVQVGTDSATGLTSLTFDATSYALGGGVTLNVFYNYAMASSVETGLFGNGSPGFWASDMLGTAGVFKIGQVATNCFDPQANWYAGASAGVKVIAGGLFTDAANAAAGFVPTNVAIRALPTASVPFLELQIGA